MKILIFMVLLCLSSCAVVVHKDAVIDGKSLKVRCPEGYHVWVKEDKEGDVFTQAETTCIKIPADTKEYLQ